MRKLFSVMLLLALPSTALAGSAALSWQAANRATSYKVMKQVGSAAYTQLAVVTAPTVTYTDPNVTAGQSYCYQIVASNSVGDAPASQPNCPTTAAPDQVTGLVITITLP